ncbi:MAG: CRISPR-associated endonuclease Cas2 [Firmicutes bacterium HGW-Firmicutes-8]|nr:MAG: CRISPR-associated endonuclease Cas2 [Firmicutes bacterium HGW-Firmicutes-8]
MVIRFMRLLVFFDLPVTSNEERRIATKFRKFLIKDGFYMVQYSVYCRICNGYDSVRQHEKLVEVNIPKQGSVRSLIVTENQYQGIKLLVGKKKPNERKYIEGQITIF